MDVLGEHGASKHLKLDETAIAVGLPGKLGFDGSQVAEAFAAGRLSEVRAYCETDVLNLYGLYLRWAYVVGKTDAEGYESAVAGLMSLLDVERRIVLILESFSIDGAKCRDLSTFPAQRSTLLFLPPLTFQATIFFPDGSWSRLPMRTGCLRNILVAYSPPSRPLKNRARIRKVPRAWWSNRFPSRIAMSENPNGAQRWHTQRPPGGETASPRSLNSSAATSEKILTFIPILVNALGFGPKRPVFA